MRSFIILCRVIGIISFLLCIVLLADRMVKPRGYRELLAEDFGTQERIAQLTRSMNASRPHRIPWNWQPWIPRRPSSASGGFLVRE